MKNRKTEKGQAIILIVFAMIGLIALTGLTVDGGMAYADRRRAQNAADAAAFAGGLANAKGELIEPAAKAIAATNGYNHNNGATIVAVTVADTPAGGCEEDQGVNKDITVQITSTSNTYFAPVIGLKTITNTVTATARACGTYVAPIFQGQAVVGLKPTTNPCAYDTGNSGAVHWEINGSGIFSNSCAFAKNTTTVDLNGNCVTSVGTASNFSCAQQNQTASAYTYPDDILAMMPPNPCDGDPDDEGQPQPSPVGGTVTMTEGVYCISNLDAYDKKDIILSDATMYVTDLDFDLKFAGGGSFQGTPTISGDFAGYYMVIAYDNTPCDGFSDNTSSQRLLWRGNGSADMYGTILAPSACIDLRGNPDATMFSQVIGYIVGSNGNADVNITYQPELNRRQAVYPTIQLIK